MFTAAGWRGEIKKKGRMQDWKSLFWTLCLETCSFLEGQTLSQHQVVSASLYRTFDVCEVASQSF